MIDAMHDIKIKYQYFLDNMIFFYVNFKKSKKLLDENSFNN
jgi:hypothetical protein